MQRFTVLLALLFLFGCDSKNDTDTKADNTTKIEIPTKKEINKEVDSQVKDVLNKRAPKWVINYTGDMKGTIQGGIMVAMGMPSFTKVTGGAMTKDMKAKAPESFMLTIMNKATPPTATMNLNLADGTKCTDAGSSTIKVIDKESKTFHGEASGALKCGDKKITYTAKMNKKP